MAVFAFYKYKLRPIPRETVLNFPDINTIQDEITMDNVFEVLFYDGARLDLKVVTKKKDGSYDDKHVIDSYTSDVLTNHKEIIVLSIENNKTKQTIIDKVKVEHEHHPFSNVIIDYGHDFIAIERSTAFDNKPEKVHELIVSSFNHMFFKHGFKIELYPLSRPIDDFWEAINVIRTRHNDRVKKISLDFCNHGIKTDTSSSDLVAIFTEISKRAEAKGLWSIEAEGNSEVNINAIHEDLINIAQVCVDQQQYDLVVSFQSYGIYRYGSDVFAQYGVEFTVIENFINDIDEFDLFDGCDSLDRWLSKMRDLFIDYNAQAPVSRPTKQGDRR